MAPTKNPNVTCNSNTSSSNGNGATEDSKDSAAAAANVTNGSNKKHTGTVPKATAPVLRMERDTSQLNTNESTMNYVAAASSGKTKSTTKRSTATLIQQPQQQQQQQQQSLTNSAFATERASPLSIVTATQHPQQTQQQLHQRKNTEIVAPIRRDLKDLNDYLLSTVVTTANNSNNNSNSNNQQQLYAPQQHQLKQHNSTKSQQHHQLQQQQLNDNNSTNSSGFDIETITDNQSRFCYPVRPIPRRNLHHNDTNDFNSSHSNSSASNLNQLNSSTAVGVVIPTTPGILNNNNSNSNIPLTATNEDILTVLSNTNNFLPSSFRTTNINSASSAINQQRLLLLQQLQQQVEEQQSSLFSSNNQQTLANLLDLTTSTLTPSNDINLLRLQLIQKIISLSSKTNTTATVASANLTPQLNKTQNTKMVNEINSPTASDRDVIVNSTSLEDVALSEMSDNRAQSIQSLHSAIETPTPDNTPTYDELQQRLEASNRNIQNMQEQQQQLIRLQNQAKQHLGEMEALRQQTVPLSFGQQNGNNVNGSDVPEYQSIEQVHSDMASLVGRMKNLTTFIQNQNELGNLLGDDGPDILAEQEVLQRKLESLRVQRDEMRNLVGELQDINRNAEKTAKDRRQEIERNEEDSKRKNNTTVSAPATAAARIVPVEYSRIVPIEVLQAAAVGGSRVRQSDVAAISPQNNVEELDPIESELIRQKVADIEAMKAQLKRLKDMMETVNLIEEHTANRPAPKDIGRSATAVNIPVQRERTNVSNRSSYDRERTPTINNQENDEYMSARVRMLNDVTSDLRAQALSLQAERDRIKALKDEIVRRKEQAAAAAQMGEDALKRNSLTPTPQLQRKAEEQVERDLLKEEYEVKKKEFEQLCQRLQNEDNCTSTPTALRTGMRHDVVSEADDEAEEVNDSDFGTGAAGGKYYSGVTTSQSRNSSLNETKNVASATTTATAASNERRGKDSIDSTAAIVNTTHDTAASLEAASMQSGSSQSYSMPPPMHQLNTTTAGWLPGPIPPPLPSSWNPHYYYGSHPPTASFTPPQFSGMHSVGPIQHPPPPPSSTECICSASNSAATLGNASSTAPVAGITSAAQLGDPMLMQQFVQTQQMLINSMCQCNQMLWHQQREIDALNNTIHMLQDRLLTLAGPSTADLAFNIRAESVPPPSTLTGSLPINNNIYASIQNRAQSEQPITFMPTPRVSSAAYANFHQQQQLQQQQHLFHQRQRSTLGTTGYNYATETQHQNASSASTSIYSTLNNAVPPPPPPQFNNEAPQSPMSGAGPGPIFMHHHNNSIHQNNANLRTQNQHANNLQQQQQQHSNIAGSNTLNNQVPPGNRANNYWDNFRSYSRQNLLSTNSNKSNEDQNQQHLQQLDQQYQPQVPHALDTLSQEQPQQQPADLYQQRQINIANDCNNLNYDNSNNTSSNNNNTSCSKYLRSLQRSRINQLQQQCQQNVENMLPTTNTRNSFQPNVLSRELLENLNWPNSDVVDNIYDNYNIALNDMPATYNTPSVATAANARNMNMNLNFGNSAQYQRNKVPAKPTCRGAVALNHNSSGLQLSRQQLQQYQNQRFNLLPQSSVPPPLPPSVPRNSHNRNRERERDFLLCTVDMTDGYNYVATPTDELVPQGDVADEFTDNMAVLDDDEDDTTSEEIKRNLLVNALKNDKFTTKFYESIKEDVFRRLESLLLEKETTERSHSSSSSQQQQFLSQLFNDVGNNVAANNSADNGNGAARDPTRKLYLNAQMGNQSQRQHVPERDCEATMRHLKLEIDADEYDNNNAEETESNNADNDIAPLEQTASNNVLDAANLESEEPEENENQGQSRATATGTENSNITTNGDKAKIRSNSCERGLTKHTVNGITKKRKNQRQRNNINTIDTSMTGACALPTGDHQQGQNINSTNNNNVFEIIENTPDYELINYIIARIHNQTQANTLINDTLLVEIAKLTATAAQNCATLTDNLSMQHQQQQTLLHNISPKKIYAKIKKLGVIPRQRDLFLVWYQDYLKTIFVVNNKHALNIKKQEQYTHSSKKTQLELTNENIVKNSIAQSKQQQKLQNSSSSTITAPAETKANPNNKILGNVGNLEINDADLAEADQICSANTSSNNSTLLLSSEDLTDTNVASSKEQCFVELKEENNFDINLNTAAKQQHVKNEYEELENNENPEEEATGGACNSLNEKEANDNDEEKTVLAVVTAMPDIDVEAASNFNMNMQALDALPIITNGDENNISQKPKEFAKRNSLA